MRAREFITETSAYRLKDLATIKTNFPEADFWLQRKGSVKTIGTPTKSFSPENIGIKVAALDVIDPGYLYYMMMHIHNTGYWQQFAKVALQLVHISTSDVANIKFGNSVEESLNFNITEYKVDNDINGKGLGATGYNSNVKYRGLRVLMRPSTFLSLAAHISSPTSVDYIVQHMKNGGALGSPYLVVDVPEKYFKGDFTGLNFANVVGHEGRNRMLAIQKLEGDDPVEVHLFGYGEIRARDFTPDIIEQLQVVMRNQDGKLIFSKAGELLFEPL